MKIRRRLLISLITILLCVPVGIAQAQDDDTQPLDDEFVEALVMMTVNHNLVAGKNELSDLSALHDFVDEYYDQRIDAVKNSAATDAESNAAVLQQQKDKMLTTIQQDIQKKKEGYRFVLDFLNLFTTPDIIESKTPPDTIRKVVSGSDEPPGDYFVTMNSLIMTDFEAQVNLLLDIHTFDVQPVLAPALGDQSPWSYDLPSISDSTAPISPPADDDNSPASTTPNDQPSGTGIEEPIRKLLRFDNNGFDAVTVLVETYIPADGYSPADRPLPRLSSRRATRAPTWNFPWARIPSAMNGNSMQTITTTTTSTTIINSPAPPR